MDTFDPSGFSAHPSHEHDAAHETLATGSSGAHARDSRIADEAGQTSQTQPLLADVIPNLASGDVESLSPRPAVPDTESIIDALTRFNQSQQDYIHDNDNENIDNDPFPAPTSIPIPYSSFHPQHDFPDFSNAAGNTLDTDVDDDAGLSVDAEADTGIKADANASANANDLPNADASLGLDLSSWTEDQLRAEVLRLRTEAARQHEASAASNHGGWSPGGSLADTYASPILAGGPAGSRSGSEAHAGKNKRKRGAQSQPQSGNANAERKSASTSRSKVKSTGIATPAERDAKTGKRVEKGRRTELGKVIRAKIRETISLERELDPLPAPRPATIPAHDEVTQSSETPVGIIEQTDLPANLTEGASLIIPESLENDASSSAGLAVDQPIGEEGTVWEVPDWEASLSSGSNVKWLENIIQAVCHDLQTQPDSKENRNVPEGDKDLEVIRASARTAFLNYCKRYKAENDPEHSRRKEAYAKHRRRWARKDLKQKRRAKAALDPAFSLLSIFESLPNPSSGDQSHKLGMDGSDPLSALTSGGTLPPSALRMDYMSSEYSSAGEDSDQEFDADPGLRSESERDPQQALVAETNAAMDAAEDTAMPSKSDEAGPGSTGAATVSKGSKTAQRAQIWHQMLRPKGVSAGQDPMGNDGSFDTRGEVEPSKDDGGSEQYTLDGGMGTASTSQSKAAQGHLAQAETAKSARYGWNEGVEEKVLEVRTPLWRSERLNQIYARLDEIATAAAQTRAKHVHPLATLVPSPTAMKPMTPGFASSGYSHEDNALGPDTTSLNARILSTDENFRLPPLDPSLRPPPASITSPSRPNPPGQLPLAAAAGIKAGHVAPSHRRFTLPAELRRWGKMPRDVSASVNAGTGSTNGAELSTGGSGSGSTSARPAIGVGVAKPAVGNIASNGLPEGAQEGSQSARAREQGEGWMWASGRVGVWPEMALGTRRYGLQQQREKSSGKRKGKQREKATGENSNRNMSGNLGAKTNGKRRKALDGGEVDKSASLDRTEGIPPAEHLEDDAATRAAPVTTDEHEASTAHTGASQLDEVMRDDGWTVDVWGEGSVG